MPVEIKEIVIKTTIQSMDAIRSGADRSGPDLEQIRRELIETCQKMINENQKKLRYKR